ncbi:hypothetical protein A2U01_0106812, partial [Trifolium medium]|nr:hypothetical protein [Trifolium medium]
VKLPEGFSLKPEKASKYWIFRRFLVEARESELSMMTQRSTGQVLASPAVRNIARWASNPSLGELLITELV